MDFDEQRIYYSHQNLHNRNGLDDDDDDEGDIANQGRVDDSILDGDAEDVDLRRVRRHFKEFLRTHRKGNRYLYRERLLRAHRRDDGGDGGGEDDEDGAPTTTERSSTTGSERHPAVEVDLAHVGEYDAALLGLLLSRPSFVLPAFEAAASDALRTLLFDARRKRRREDDDGGGEGGETNNDGDDVARDDDDEPSPVQILLAGNLGRTALRAITAAHMNKLLRCPGIVVQAARVRSRASRVRVRCGRCAHEKTLPPPAGPFASSVLPYRCEGPGEADECGPKPYAVVPDKCEFVDGQTLKLQESPETVPTGEMPRSVVLSCERDLVDRAPPGTRVDVIAVACLMHTHAGTRQVYLRVVGMQKETNTQKNNDDSSFTRSEEQAFRQLAKRNDVYNVLWNSVAPSLSGAYTVDIKKAIICLLLGGSRKVLPDKARLRGDINVLLIGDPSTAKSQFLKFVQRAAPIAVYTSGKGSSAAGLTASVVRDAKGDFYLEGGAMVLADGGVVCIDEFDKMRPADRVAIHEAMEQQTISVAKAGITTVLNSRAAVLAAANPVFGRYDDARSASENIDLMTTILSRFDLIFLVRDERDEERDRDICRHVVGVHMDADPETAAGTSETLADRSGLGALDAAESAAAEVGGDAADSVAETAARVAAQGGVLDVPALRKYVQYCRAKCRPRLSEEAGDVLASAYVRIRDDVRRRTLEAQGENGDGDDGGASVIPITVRQLEALVRVSESLAKMRLEEEVHARDVAEAMRLFKISTGAANAAGSGGPGGEGGSVSSREDTIRAEAFLRSRLVVGATVNKQRILEEAAGQGHNVGVVARAAAIMCARGELLERNQSRLIKRIK